jgi:hypothetical protein
MDIATGTPGVGVTRSEPPVPAANEVATWVSPMRPIEIEFNLPGGKDFFQQGLIRQAQKVLESALVNATQTVPMSKTGLALDKERVESLEWVSPEFLTWMLQGKRAPPFSHELQCKMMP